MRPVLRYHGGKWLLADWILSLMPSHRCYVEPFAGAASVLMQKPRSYAEVYNDKWDTVVNVFRVLRDPEQAARLEQLLSLTPFSRTEFDSCGELELEMQTDPVEKARRTIFRSFAGFGSASTNSKHATGFRCNSNRSGTTPAHDWVNYPDGIRAYVERLQGVVIENRDAAVCMAQHDTSDTLFFVDPPYVHSTRNMARGNSTYAHDLMDDEHVKLAEVLHSLKGMVMLCGYPSEMYDSLYAGWERVERAALADGAQKRTECLWFNPAASMRIPQARLDLATSRESSLHL